MPKHDLTDLGCLRTVHSETGVPEATGDHKPDNDPSWKMRVRELEGGTHLLSTVATNVLDRILIF